MKYNKYQNEFVSSNNKNNNNKTRFLLTFKNRQFLKQNKASVHDITGLSSCSAAGSFQTAPVSTWVGQHFRQALS